MHPDLPPPPGTVGLVGWLRRNLFSSVVNSVLTVRHDRLPGLADTGGSQLGGVFGNDLGRRPLVLSDVATGEPHSLGRRCHRLSGHERTRRRSRLHGDEAPIGEASAQRDPAVRCLRQGVQADVGDGRVRRFGRPSGRGGAFGVNIGRHQGAAASFQRDQAFGSAKRAEGIPGGGGRRHRGHRSGRRAGILRHAAARIRLRGPARRCLLDADQGAVLSVHGRLLSARAGLAGGN